MAARQPRRSPRADTTDQAPGMETGAAAIAGDLSYGEARTALDLALAQLQATDLDVEAMAGLYQRAQSYARRCEALLAAVEQEVLLWDSAAPDSEPAPYRPEPTGA